MPRSLVSDAVNRARLSVVDQTGVEATNGYWISVYV